MEDQTIQKSRLHVKVWFGFDNFIQFAQHLNFEIKQSLISVCQELEQGWRCLFPGNSVLWSEFGENDLNYYEPVVEMWVLLHKGTQARDAAIPELHINFE